MLESATYDAVVPEGRRRGVADYSKAVAANGLNSSSNNLLAGVNRQKEDLPKLQDILKKYDFLDNQVKSSFIQNKKYLLEDLA